MNRSEWALGSGGQARPAVCAVPSLCLSPALVHLDAASHLWMGSELTPTFLQAAKGFCPQGSAPPSSLLAGSPGRIPMAASPLWVRKQVVQVAAEQCVPAAGNPGPALGPHPAPSSCLGLLLVVGSAQPGKEAGVTWLRLALPSGGALALSLSSALPSGGLGTAGRHLGCLSVAVGSGSGQDGFSCGSAQPSLTFLGHDGVACLAVPALGCSQGHLVMLKWS